MAGLGIVALCVGTLSLSQGRAVANNNHRKNSRVRRGASNKLSNRPTARKPARPASSTVATIEKDLWQKSRWTQEPDLFAPTG